MKTEKCTQGALDRFLKKAKNRKSPGTDGIPVEFYKWLTEQAREYVLDILNELWEMNGS